MAKLSLGEIRSMLLHAASVNGIEYQPENSAATAAGYPGMTLGDMYETINDQATQHGLSCEVEINGDWEDDDDPDLSLSRFIMHPAFVFWWCRRKDYEA